MAGAKQEHLHCHMPWGWEFPSRSKLDAGVLAQRTTISLIVPEAEAQRAVEREDSESWTSQPVYAAGTGWELSVSITAVPCEGNGFAVDVALKPCAYSCDGAQVTNASPLVHVQYDVSFFDGAWERSLLDGAEILGSRLRPNPATLDWGNELDWDELFVEGELKLTAKVQVL
jgi:hypothetical protein